MGNLECNAVSAVQVTHLLLSRMRAKKLRGCFVYTSSGACSSGHVRFEILGRERGGAAIEGRSCNGASGAKAQQSLFCFRCFKVARSCLCAPLPSRCAGSGGHDPQPIQRAVRVHQVVPLR